MILRWILKPIFAAAAAMECELYIPPSCILYVGDPLPPEPRDLKAQFREWLDNCKAVEELSRRQRQAA